MKKSIQSKNTVNFREVGELPNNNVRGITAQAKALRNKFRSPFGFTSAKTRPAN